MKAPRLYRHLAFAHQFGLADGGWSTLYLAPDHLLLRTSNRFAESYRRFYFRDIEAITICKTVRGIIWNFIWSFALFMSVMFLIYRAGWGPAIFAGVFSALLLVNLARGATCSAKLQTRVQTRPLPLRRLRKAFKVVGALESQIIAAQADLAPAAAATPENVRTWPPPLPAPALAPPPLPGEGVARARGWVHLVAFGLLSLGGILALWESRAHQLVLMYCAYAAIFLNLGWGIAALVQQRRIRLPAAVIPLAWIDVVGHAFGVPVVFTGFSIPWAMQAARISQATHGARPTQMGLLDLRGMPGFHYVLLAYGAICLLLGAAGFILIFQRPARPASAP